MNPVKIVAIVLIAAGILGLAYGGFHYTKQTNVVKMGSMEMSVNNRETVKIPIWVGVGAIVVGGVLLIVPGNRKNN